MLAIAAQPVDEHHIERLDGPQVIGNGLLGLIGKPVFVYIHHEAVAG